MSIAVSAVVQPSRFLRVATAVMALASAATGIAIGIGGIGAGLPAPARTLLAAVVVFLSFFGFYHGVRHRKPIHIDISGTGQIRIAKPASNAPCMELNRPHVWGMGEVVRLTDCSTIWPSMLLLHLKADSGEVTIVPVMRDSVPPDGFRALSVACRWISQRKDESEREIL
ncbi:MAG TPA: flagellar hook-length control protein [Noviherbaspirillum sp.]|uniref:flagellar hook-length control protein n=1 Tax=Noviherbaspirillum sp. TaxID=1926288 RepID=UPI002D410F57|nr:flagellar hook-length control protein [Noviherbaspirillum sp.]HYD97644.1 flagellar hook-length control protein [Noviherbaspirillum sp.]